MRMLCVMVCIFVTIFLFAFFFCYKRNRHLWNGANWCIHNLAHILILRFLLYFHFYDSYVRMYISVYALPSSSILMHIYRHMYMYKCFDYSVIIPYNLYTPIIMCLCVPASTDCSLFHVWTPTVWTPTPCAAKQSDWFEYTTKYIKKHINNISYIK